MAVPARAAFLLVPMLLALVALAPTHRAHACSIIGFPHALPNLVEDSSVAIAIGEFGASHGDAIEFHVTDPIRGTVDGQELLVNNRELELSPGCDVLLGAPGSVRFSSGEQVLLFLEADDLGVGAAWRPADFGYAVTHLNPDGTFKPRGERQPASLQQLRPKLEALDSIPYDPSIELTGPCNPKWFYPELLDWYGQMSQLVVLGTFEPIPGTSDKVRVMVEEAFKGTPGDVVEVNAHQFVSTGECARQMTDNTWPISGRALVFLVSDEFGVAEWRPAHWGEGIILVDGDIISGYERFPSVALVRELVAAGPPYSGPTPVPAIAPAVQPTAQSQDQPVPTRAPTESEANSFPWIATVAIAGVVTLAIVGAAYWRLHGRARHGG